MIIKMRNQPEELRILTSLNTRMELPEKDRQKYWSLLKGYEGELHFDRWIDPLETENLILNDLLLEVSGSMFQIDFLVIFQDTIYLFEIKNYEGDYYYDGEKLRTINGKEVKDPLLQLKRSESLLRQLLNTLGYHVSINAFVIYVHPEFALFQAPLDQPIILPNQMNRFLNKLNNIKSKISVRNTKLAEKLLSLHLPESPMERNHEYEYGELKKGVFCVECGGALGDYKWPSLTCTKCGTQENVESTIFRSVEEYRLLFPKEKITTNTLFDWCGYLIPKRTIKPILRKNFKTRGYGQWTYYE